MVKQEKNTPIKPQLSILIEIKSVITGTEIDKIYETRDWMEPYNSGETADVPHIWYEKGDYNNRVMVKNVNGEESSWPDPLSITMSKNNAINPFILLLDRFIEQFLILEQIIFIIQL